MFGGEPVKDDAFDACVGRNPVAERLEMTVRGYHDETTDIPEIQVRSFNRTYPQNPQGRIIFLHSYKCISIVTRDHCSMRCVMMM
mmetsp:Transcript_9073/g.21075  ORF Transcript_9073/g.21075 Transcript_9073/m.21075 type:complete len:85 (-) Transcript_9073:157-411(-)